MGVYEAVVARLYSANRFIPVKLGLYNMQVLHESMRLPSFNYKNVHVAGTNGKGSVSLKISKGLEASGYKTGLFVSPHISTFRERVQINGELIPEAAVVDIVEDIWHTAETCGVKPTFFEITTLLAMKHFDQEGVDIAVFETGLGGRLDSTNIVKPECSVITSIGLDHTRVLGSTIEEIAKEKAGIMKLGVPVVVGPNCPQTLLRHCAERVGAPFHPIDPLPSAPSLSPPPSLSSPPMREKMGVSDFEAENNAVVEATLQRLQEAGVSISSTAAACAVAAKPPCRFQQLNVDVDVEVEVDVDGRSKKNANAGPRRERVRVVLDAAHNGIAMARLFEKVRIHYPLARIRLVVGLCKDKGLKDCLRTALAEVDPDRLHLVQASHPRAAPPSTLLAAAEAVLEEQLSEGGGGGGGYRKGRSVIATPLPAALLDPNPKPKPKPTRLGTPGHSG